MIATYLLLAERETIVISGGWVFLFMGLIFAPIGLVAVFRSIRFIMRGVRTRATVSEYTGDGTPVVKFVDQSGTEQRAEVSTTRGGTPVGQQLEIIYTLTNPADACDPGFSTLWLVPLLCAFLGGISLIGGILTLLGVVELSGGP
jgi:hypothetical protein